MDQKIINWRPTSVQRGRDKAKVDADRNLRMEVLELRRLLGEADRGAARQTILLREGDHRIKNSLQIVVSLMSLQAGRETTESAREALLTASQRILSIARIHDALQASDGADSVDLGAVVTKTCELLKSMAADPGRITLIVDVERVDVPVTVAQPLALAVNELVVNALRHAFPGERCGVVRIGLNARDGRLSISVADNGVGLPDDHAAGTGYGMRLVQMVVEQVYGSLSVTNPPGATFTITAPLAKPDLDSLS